MKKQNKNSFKDEYCICQSIYCKDVNINYFQGTYRRFITRSKHKHADFEITFRSWARVIWVIQENPFLHDTVSYGEKTTFFDQSVQLQVKSDKYFVSIRKLPGSS